MGKSKKDKGKPKSKKFNQDSDFSQSFSAPAPTRFKAVCCECGDSCELPFRPSGDRPVYCSTCFEKQRSSDSRPSFGRDNRNERRDRNDRYDRNDRHDRPRYDAICDSCKKNCQVTFRPTPGKPIYCSDCFGKHGNKNANRPSDSGDTMKQLRLLNEKMDRLVKLLDTNKPSIVPAKINEAPKEAKPEKIATPKKAKSATKKTSAKKKK